MQNFHQFCRLCAKPFSASCLFEIFHVNADGADALEKMLSQYMPFSVTADDGLPNKICKSCRDHVIQWHIFLTLCVDAQLKLNKIARVSGLLAPADASAVEDININIGDVIIGDKNLPAISVQSQPCVGIEGKNFNVPRKTKKTNYCIARWCNNGNNMGISLFRLPKDKIRALNWLKAANRMDLANKSSAYLYRCYLCATHFKKEMFLNSDCKSLCRNALPSIFPKPSYAYKMELNQINAETYPKEFQGMPLKNILPKTMSLEITSNISIKKLFSHGRSQQQSEIPVPLEPNQQPENQVPQVQFSEHPIEIEPVHVVSVELAGISSPKPINFLRSENHEIVSYDQTELLEAVSEVGSREQSEITSSRNVNHLFASQTSNEAKQNQEILIDAGGEITLVSDNTFNTLSMRDESEGDVNVTQLSVNENNSSNKHLTKNLMHMVSSDVSFNEGNNVGTVDLSKKLTSTTSICTATETSDRSMDHEVFRLPKIVSENSFGLNMTNADTSSLQSPQPEESLNFDWKNLNHKDNSTCLENIVVPQDFLLMHSFNNLVEPPPDHNVRQNDKNLNNLCCAETRESTPETHVSYEDRSITAEASVRAIECTSPNHGQIIEGLINLDQVLESG